MAESQFWHLASPDSTARLAEWVPGEIETEKVVCPVDAGHRRGGKRLTNLSVALRGNGVEDFVWTWLSECLVQDNVLEIFRKNGFTGFDVKPMKAKFKRDSDNNPPRLWELLVMGWAGMASAESGIKLTKECRACGLLRYSRCVNPGKLIDVSQWDGSDFFMVWPLPKFIFITERVARVIRDNAITGVVLQRPADISFGMVPFIGPGRLSYRMPPERARELGGALGID
jgi:hypothetical protein